MSVQRLAVDNTLAADTRGASGLKGLLRENRTEGIREAARQFEALFLQMMMKSMRETTSQDGLLDSDATRFFTGMLDEQFAKNISKQGGLGLARTLEEQLARRMSAADDLDDGSNRMEEDMMNKNATNAPGSPANIADAAATNLPLAALKMLTAAMERATMARQTYVDAPKLAGSVEKHEMSSREFARTVWPHAVEASRKTGVPPHFLIAHAALESGWGQRDIKNADGTTSHNLFGIKANESWSGKSVEITTTEYTDGKPRSEKARFRSYASYTEAFADYARLLTDNPRYGSVIGSQNGTEFARRLQQAGYATDPKYAEKLAAIIDGATLRQALIG